MVRQDEQPIPDPHRRNFTLDEISELLYVMRYEAGMTQGDLGRKFGWKTGKNSCGNIAKYESGSRVPQIDTLSRWAEACGFTMELVVRESESIDMKAFGVDPREWKLTLHRESL